MLLRRKAEVKGKVHGEIIQTRRRLRWRSVQAQVFFYGTALCAFIVFLYFITRMRG